VKSSTYLRSLGIPYDEHPSKISRLSITSTFTINGLRGICLRVKRLGISKTYLEILNNEQIGVVLVDGQDQLPTVFVVTDRAGSPKRLRALPVSSPSIYPNTNVVEVVSKLLTEAAQTESEVIQLGFRMIEQKLDDERMGTQLFLATLALEEETQFLRGVIGEDPRGRKDLGLDRIQTAAALLAGYRLTPHTSAELAILLEFGSRLTKDVSMGGLPPSLAFAFSGEWVRAKRLAVVTQSVGSHLLGLSTADEGVVLLPTISGPAIQFLKRLFPSSSFLEGEFLEWNSREPFDRLIVVPPLGCRITAHQQLERSQFAQSDGKRPGAIAAESLFIEHALRNAADDAVIMVVVPEGLLASVGNSDFREWLLHQAQLLAVVSLPPGSCFRGTSVRCSLLYIRKRATQLEDYSILFAELQEEDLLDEKEIGALKAAIDNAVEGTLQRCA
jgi:N-6 DNA Methylase